MDNLTPINQPFSAKNLKLASLAGMAVLLFLVLHFGLLGALLAGFVVYSCSMALAGSLLRRLDSLRGQQVATALVALLIVGLLIVGGIYLVDFLRGGGIGMVATKISEVLNEIRPHLPTWITTSWPSSFDTTGEWLGSQVQEHADTAQALGQDFAHSIGRLVIGMFLGGVVAVSQAAPHGQSPPLVQQMMERLNHFTIAFQQVVGAQVKIAGLNTVFTGLFLVCALPLLGVQMPLVKTLIILTFLFGLVPVLGNLASNTAITLVALSVAPWVAGLSLLYLIVIHKVEYLLNARIVGGHIEAKAWELLVSMLLMEAIFGIPGIIAAPIYYAYLKREMRAGGLL